MTRSRFHHCKPKEGVSKVRVWRYWNVTNLSQDSPTPCLCWSTRCKHHCLPQSHLSSPLLLLWRKEGIEPAASLSSATRSVGDVARSAGWYARLVSHGLCRALPWWWLQFLAICATCVKGEAVGMSLFSASGNEMEECCMMGKGWHANPLVRP